MKFLICIFTSIFFLSTGFSQETKVSKNSSTIYIGYPGDYFDNPDLGFYVGYNKQFRLLPRFSWEAQAALSYSQFDRDDNNFAHDGGNTTGVLIVVGPRLYLNKASKKTRLFINILAGPSFFVNSEYRNDGVSPEEYLFEENIFGLGYSLGAYLEFKDRFLIGTAFETRTSQVVKIGLKF